MSFLVPIDSQDIKEVLIIIGGGIEGLSERVAVERGPRRQQRGVQRGGQHVRSGQQRQQRRARAPAQRRHPERAAQRSRTHLMRQSSAHNCMYWEEITLGLVGNYLKS